MRNVALLGRAGAGASTLRRALTGQPTNGGTGLRHGVVRHRGVSITLLDPPGRAELVLARTAALRGADAALLVVPASGGLDPLTGALWRSCVARELPRAIVLTFVDAPGADVDEALALCRRLLDEDLLPLTLPVHDDEGTVAGVLDLLDLQLQLPGSSRPAEPEHAELVAGLRAELLEQLVPDSDDPTLLDRYLDGTVDGTEPEVRAVLHDVVRRGVGTPVLTVAAPLDVGLTALLDLVVGAFPSPAQSPCPPVTNSKGHPGEPLTADPRGPFVAEVLRGGEAALVRLWSGTVTADGAPQWSGPSAGAGQIVFVDGLLDTGATLSQDGSRLSTWGLPDPLHPVAVVAPPGALEQAVRLDPSLRLEHRHDTGQTLLWCQGPDHAGITIAGLRQAGHEIAVTAVELPQRRDGGPWYALQALVAAGYSRRVTTALSRFGIDVTCAPDADHDADDDVRVSGQVPLSAMTQLAADLAAAAHGTASATLRPL